MTTITNHLCVFTKGVSSAQSFIVVDDINARFELATQFRCIYINIQLMNVPGQSDCSIKFAFMVNFSL